MAIIVEGKTVCPICGDVIKNNDKVVMFPPFTGNKKDPLFFFSDSGFHESCFSKHELKDQILTMIDKSRNGIGNPNRKCMITGEVIKLMDNEEVISMITSDSSEELFAYNFFRFDKDNLNNWRDREKFLTLLEKFKEEGKWESIGEFNYLDHLINLIRVKGK